MTKKEQALWNLRDFSNACFACDIRFMLMEGTLLGAYREKDFIINDEKDIDLGIHDRHFKNYDCLVKRLRAVGFTNSKIVTINGEIHGGAFVRGTNHIDVMRMIKKGNHVINYGLQGKLYYIYTADIFRGYSIIDFHGNPYKAPKKIEKFLTQRYGDWKTPIPLSRYSWKDKKYSPNVRWLKDEPLEKL